VESYLDVIARDQREAFAQGSEATKQSILPLRCAVDCFACARNDGLSSVIVREGGRSSIPETSAIERKAAAYWIPRQSLSSDGALRRPGGGGWRGRAVDDAFPLPATNLKLLRGFPWRRISNGDF
jgi:hypothetical protein